MRLILRRRTAKQIHPGAHIPNQPSARLKAVAPTVNPVLRGRRKHLHMVMLATLGNPYLWDYFAVRPLRLPRRRLKAAEMETMPALKKALGKLVSRYRSDCSWGVKTLFYLTGIVDDPTGENWNGYGNSGSTYLHLRKRPGLDNAYSPTAAQLAKCKIGDILLVGVNGSEHMALIMEPGPDPLVWSDGHQGAPDSYNVLTDTRRPISVCIPKGWD